MPALDFSGQADVLDFSSKAEVPKLPDFSSQAAVETVEPTATAAPETEPKSGLQSLKEFLTLHPTFPKPVKVPDAPADAGLLEKAATTTAQAVSGLTTAGIGAAEGALTPLTAGLIAASAIPVVGRPLAIAAGAGFGSHMSILGAQQFYEAVKKGDVQGAFEGLGNTALGALMFGGSLKTAAKPVDAVVETKLAPITTEVAKEVVAIEKPVAETTAGTPEPIAPTPPSPTLAPLTEAVAKDVIKPEEATPTQPKEPSAIQEPAPAQEAAPISEPKAETDPTPVGMSPAAEAQATVQAWGKYSEEVVKPLEKQVRDAEREVFMMGADASLTKPGTKSKSKLTKKAFLEKYGVATMEEANEQYKSKHAIWSEKTEELTKAKDQLSELNRLKEQAGKNWSRAVSIEKEAKAAPKATVAEPIPTPEESTALGISPTAHPAIQSIAGLFNPGAVSKLTGSVKDFFGAYAGRSMPKITRADRETGELGVRWASSRIAAKPLADVFSTEVIGDSGIDPKKLGTALTEDNLRSVREGFIAANDPAAAAGVHSVIGSRGSPFATEADYQAFLADPNTQAAIARYKQLWDAQVDPMYKNAMFIDPNEVLPDRGLQTGARVNLFAVQNTTPNTVEGIGQGSLLGTLKRKSPFGIRAKGTGQSYNGNLVEMMQNTFGRQLEIANKNAFETKMVETGNAVIDKPGQHPILKDETTVAFPYARQRVIITKGQPPPSVTSQNKSIYIRKSLAKEYSRASNTETKLTGGSAMQGVTGLINRSALAGFTDATVHVSNLATVLMTRPAVAGKWWQDAALSATGRADLIPIAYKAIAKAFKDNSKQISELSEIGAMRQEHPPSSKFNPMGWLSDLIHVADKTTRLVMDDTFKNLVKEGLVENTETNRREWVNQVGQYNKRLQDKWTAAGRDSGLAPFITAGKNFTTLGFKNISLSPGAKATDMASAAALRANVAAKWVGLGTLAGTLNYMFTHKKPGGGIAGRPGTPIGDVDSGKDDENGKPLVFPLASLLGLGRGLRVTGIRGALEAKRKGLPSRVALDAAIRDVVNSQAGMIAGPPVRFAMQAASGYSPAVSVGRSLPVVPPGESQRLSDIKGAVIEANPILSSIHAAQEPGGTIGKGLQKQFPRFSLAPKQAPEMLEHYPEIVRKAQANEYIDDVIQRARKLSPKDRIKFLDDAVAKLESPDDQAHAWLQFKRRRVLQ